MAVGVLIYLGTRLALSTPSAIQGPAISLSPAALPWYAGLSIGRMTAAYALSLLFTIFYGRLAAYNRGAERVLIPLLDVLQSIPILSFLPVVLLSFSAFLPQRAAAELSSIVLIFTSQAWNLAFSWYQSLITIPGELNEASAILRLNTWLRLKNLEAPFAAISLIWNSMISWAAGWFFLMAAEAFTVGQRDFRLPGLGSYLKEAAAQGNLEAIAWGIGALVLVIVALDQLVWRPLLAWSDRFKMESVESETAPASWFYEAVSSSRLVGWLTKRVFQPLGERVDAALVRRFPPTDEAVRASGRPSWAFYLTAGIFSIGLLYGAYLAGGMLTGVPVGQWEAIGLGIGATFLRVLVVLVIGLAWTVPVGVAIGTNPRVAAWLQPLAQIVASVPATALFPVVLLLMMQMPGGLSLAAVLMMLLGAQFYLLFNIIAGARAIPQDLKYTTALMQMGRWQRWRTLVLPALFPYAVTGAITAAGGAWNASIVAEYAEFGGRALHTTGIGALISLATASGDYPLLLAATLSLILTVVLINRLFWRRLYRMAQERYRME